MASRKAARKKTKTTTYCVLAVALLKTAKNQVTGHRFSRAKVQKKPPNLAKLAMTALLNPYALTKIRLSKLQKASTWKHNQQLSHILIINKHHNLHEGKWQCNAHMMQRETSLFWLLSAFWFCTQCKGHVKVGPKRKRPPALTVTVIYSPDDFVKAK